jgi:hypothetical protein
MCNADRLKKILLPELVIEKEACIQGREDLLSRLFEGIGELPAEQAGRMIGMMPMPHQSFAFTSLINNIWRVTVDQLVVNSGSFTILDPLGTETAFAMVDGDLHLFNHGPPKERPSRNQSKAFQVSFGNLAPVVTGRKTQIFFRHSGPHSRIIEQSGPSIGESVRVAGLHQ